MSKVSNTNKEYILTSLSKRSKKGEKQIKKDTAFATLLLKILFANKKLIKIDETPKINEGTLKKPSELPNNFQNLIITK